MFDNIIKIGYTKYIQLKENYMELIRVTRALKEIQEKTNIDFVSYNYGHCCRSCAEFGKRQEEWEKAETILVGLHYLSGMNYQGPFKDRTGLYFNWDFDFALMDTVCEVFEKFGFKVTKPKDERESLFIC